MKESKVVPYNFTQCTSIGPYISQKYLLEEFVSGLYFTK
jgi:hypothetical protein